MISNKTSYREEEESESMSLRNIKQHILKKELVIEREKGDVMITVLHLWNQLIYMLHSFL